jgi:hypothetical protein
MDIKLWIKQNPIIAGVVAVSLAYFAYDQLSGPKNYRDCMLQVVKDAKTETTAKMGRLACKVQFPY